MKGGETSRTGGGSGTKGNDESRDGGETVAAAKSGEIAFVVYTYVYGSRVYTERRHAEARPRGASCRCASVEFSRAREKDKVDRVNRGEGRIENERVPASSGTPRASVVSLSSPLLAAVS